MSNYGSEADIMGGAKKRPLSPKSGHGQRRHRCLLTANSRHEPRVGVTGSYSTGVRDGRTLVINEYDEKLRRLRLAGVATDNVNVIGTFIERLTSVKGDRLLPLNLHYDGAFQHIIECVRVMAMDGVCCAGRILDDQHRALLTGDVA